MSLIPEMGNTPRPRESTTEIVVTQRSSLSIDQGRRLVHAFLGIKDAEVRSSIISLVETMSQAYDRPLSNS